MVKNPGDSRSVGGPQVLPRNFTKTMKRVLLSIIFVAGFIAGTETSAHAMDGWWGGPFGGYCRGSGWGWYGARKQVRTALEARKLLQEYFANEDVKVGKVTDRQHFFEVEIKDKKDELVDVVIVDKRTGRIRSIY